MLGEFRKQFEELLYTKPLSYVDAMPLVLKLVQDMDDNSEAGFRVNANNYFRELQKKGLIVCDPIGGANMVAHIGGQPHSTEPVLIKSTDKFIRYYEAKNKHDGQTVTNYNTTYGHGSPIAGRDATVGDLNYSSLGLDSRPHTSPTNNQNLLSRFASWIFEHIIVVVIVTLICAFLTWKLGWN